MKAVSTQTFLSYYNTRKMYLTSLVDLQYYTNHKVSHFVKNKIYKISLLWHVVSIVHRNQPKLFETQQDSNASCKMLLNVVSLVISNFKHVKTCLSFSTMAIFIDECQTPCCIITHRNIENKNAAIIKHTFPHYVFIFI